MNVNEHFTFHSEKSTPSTKKYRGLDKSLTNNQSTDVKTHFNSPNGVYEVLKAFSGFSKVIGMALFIFISFFTNAQNSIQFNFEVQQQSWQVPTGVSCVTIEAWGAQGENNIIDGTQGGNGGFATGTLTVTPGETLFINVGGAGNLGIGGFNGGGNGTPLGIRGAGGGASDVRQGGNTLNDRVIVAGGGGGAGNLGRTGGEGGGINGGDGFDNGFNDGVGGSICDSGGGGTQISGGASLDADPGIFGFGGNSPNIGLACSGGGGGWWGGGAGNGAGGGSSFIDGVNGGVTLPGERTGNGLVIISYSTLALDCPGDLTFELASGECSKVVNLDIEVEGSCGNEVVSSPTGHVVGNNEFPIGVTQVEFEVSENGVVETCSFTVTVNEYVPVNAMACGDLVNVTLNEECQFYFTPDYLLTGNDYGCFDDYETYVMECQNCPPIPTSPIITSEYIGDTLVGKVCDPETGYCCWGYLVPEDKKKPTICCADFSMSCKAETHPDSISGITKIYEFPGLPVPIPGGSPNQDTNVVIIELEIDECDSLKITDFNVYLNISHGQLGDLSAEIEHPDGDVVPLFFRPGVSTAPPFGCGAGVIDATFDDQASNSYNSFDFSCATLGNEYIPIAANLSLFDTKNAFHPGTYKIRIEDHNPTNSGVNGVILGAAIEIGGDYANPVALDNCDESLTPTFTDVISDANCNDSCYQTITRTWCVTDDSGNEFCCDQIICLKRPDFEDLTCPPNYDDNCFDPDLVSNTPCVAIYDPVCGCNGVEYSNACFASNAGLRSWTPGPCSTASCPDNPLESQWLRDIINSRCASPCGVEVSTCTYLGQPVIDVNQDPGAPCSDPMGGVYDCYGNLIFYYGGIGGINLGQASNLQNCNVIFNCSDPLPPISLPVLSCTDTFPKDANGHPDPIFTGRPQLDGCDVDGFCMFYCIYEDDVIPVCEGSYIIVREWECWDWCTGEDTTCQQIIKIMDNDPPEIICPPDMTLNADDDCLAGTILPPPNITDVCSPSGTSYSASVIGEGDISQSNGNWILSNIPIGTTTVCYAGIDGCGNKDTCYFDVTVIDNTPPVAKCKSWRTISISSDSSYCTASHFDDGSYDECSNVSFMVRRFTNPNCIPPEGQETNFGPEVYFYCCDVGDTIAVELKVTDAAGLMNFCTSYMIVEDNLAPIHTYCPPDTSVACTVDIGDYNNTGGEPDFFDNCELDTIIVTNDSMLFSCGLGMVFRKWVAIDVYGNKDSCEQKITLVNDDPFDGNTDIDWPDDTTISCEANLHPDSLPAGSQRPIPDSNGACENVTVSGPSDVIEPAENSSYCYQIRRTWTVTDSCFEDANGFIVPKDYVQDQIIKITDDEAPTFDCPISNDDTLDVGDNIDIVVTNIGDNCTDSSNIAVIYDIDQNFNGITFIPDVGGNGPDASGVAGDANYPAGDSVRTHRVRFILSDECNKSDTCYVNVKIANPFTCDDVRLDTMIINVGANPGGFVLSATNSQLYNTTPPPGIKISKDGIAPGTNDVTFTCGEIINNEPTIVPIFIHLPDGVTVCDRYVKLIDNTSPTLSCVSSITLPNVGVNTLINFVDYQAMLISNLGDNCSNITVTYSPPSVQCVGVTINQDVTVTVTDEFIHGNPITDGNPISCVIPVTIDCSAPPTFNVSGGIENEEGTDVEHVAVEVEGDNMQDVAMTGDDGTYGFNLPSVENYVITPERDDNILNGVSTYDLVLMSKHILQFELLSTPYKIIAADVNHSGTVSTIDMVALRKVILFIDNEFPNNTSWRFVDAAFVFPDPANPFSTSFPEVYTINGLTEDEIVDFVGVKIGDVNCSASPNDLVGSGDDRNADSELVFTLKDQNLKAGETYEFDFEATDFNQVQGFQFTLNFDADAIEFNDVEDGDLTNLNNANFGLHKLNEGVITASWNTLENAQTLEDGRVIFSLSFTALEDGQLSDLIKINSRFTKAEAYNHEGLLDLSLQFVDESGVIAADQFELYQNQPNPFKDETVIGFNLPESGKATFKVFDISGREIKSVEGVYSKGYNEISINRSELQGSGVLYYQLESAEHIASKKMVLLD